MSWPNRYVLVAAIEGLPWLLTDGDKSEVLAAWANTSWANAPVATATFFDFTHEHSANPWEPFQKGGTLRIITLDDEIGVWMHRTMGGAETELTQTIDREADTIQVQDTSKFPSLGFVNIGTEAIAYLNKTNTSFTDCYRGIFAPFGCDPSGNGSGLGWPIYGQNHRVGHAPYAPNIAPKVTEYPRDWYGRWVGLWVHGYNDDGTLQTRDQAQCVFAGRLVEYTDDPSSLGTVIVAEHVLTSIREATIGRDMFTGRVADGIYIPAGVRFKLRDHNGGSFWRVANDLVVIASGASGANQMNAGYYTASELFTKLNTWFNSERAANRLYGSYLIKQATTNNTEDSIRTKIDWFISGSDWVQFRLTVPKVIAFFLGFIGEPPADLFASEDITGFDTPSESHRRQGEYIPLRFLVSTGINGIRLRIEEPSGAFQDQYDSMPTKVKPVTNDGSSWGLFWFDNQVFIRAKIVKNLDSTIELHDVQPVLLESGAQQSIEALRVYGRRIDDHLPLVVRQIFMFEMTCGEFLNRLFYSGGVTGYNHATYDDMPYGCGLGIPGELLGPAWETSVANIPGSDKPISPIIDKPIKLATLLGSDLILRHAFPTWKNGGLRMQSWKTPTKALAIAALTEDNKAAPSGRSTEHRVSTVTTARWAKPIIKIEYNRNLLDSGSDYQGVINIEARTAIDDAGDKAAPFTIECRNAYTEFEQVGSGIEDLVHNSFVPVVHIFTKPMSIMRRSISLDQFLTLAPGDIVTVTDSFARDPSTGIRRVTSRPGIITSIRYNPGGMLPGQDKPAPIVGEVEIYFVATNRIYAYAPSGLIDSTANSDGFTGGYNSTTKTIRLVEHAYSEASELADAGHFAVDDFVTIHEVDPADPGSAQVWDGIRITAKNGNDITLDSDLAGFDSSKTYRLIYGLYEEVTLDQKEKAFQADETTGLVFEGTAQPYMYGQATSEIAATPSSAADLPELHAERTYGDGLPYDVGSLVGYARLVNNLIDQKTAINSPVLLSATMSNLLGTGAQSLSTLIYPVYLSTGILTNGIDRYVYVAPWFRSTDGSETAIRVYFASQPPTDATLLDPGDISPSSMQIWTTTSTNWTMGTARPLKASIKNRYGYGWIIIQCAYKCETRGLAYFREGPRLMF